MGMKSIVRGTVPLVVFGAEGYASLMGSLAMPSLLVASVAPSIGAFALESSGPAGLLGLIGVLAGANLLTVFTLQRRLKPGSEVMRSG